MNEQRPAQSETSDPIRNILLIASLATVFAGLILLQATPINDAVVIPTASWIILAGMVLAVLAFVYRPLSLFLKFNSKLANRDSLAWIIFALFLSILATIASVLIEKLMIFNFAPVVLLWLLSAFCYLMAFFPREIPQFDWKSWFQAHRVELVILTGTFLLAAFIRFYQLGDYPRVINGDEGRIGMYAQTTGSGPLSNPFALWENIGALYMQTINVIISMFGPGSFALRLLPAIGGTLAIISIYLFARQIAGKSVALIAAFMLTISHTHVHFSRTSAVIYIHGTWLIPLEMYFFLSGVQKRSAWRAALGGILLAIHMNIYLSAQIMVGVLSIYTIIAFIFFKDSFRSAWRQVLAFWGGFLITFLPEGFYMLSHPAEFLSRMNAEGTFNSGWLANEVILTGKSTAQILVERIIHAFLSLIYYPAIDFYGSSSPMLSFISGVLFLIGLTYALTRINSLKYLLLNGYFWGATVAIGAFAIPPSADTYRMLIALPPAIIMAAIALEQLLEKVGISWQKKTVQHTLLVSIVLLNLLAFNLWAYYFDFLGHCRFGGDQQTRFASYLGNYVRNLQSEEAVYLLSTDIFIYGSHDSVNFLTKNRPITNFPDPVSSLNPVSGETIIASPTRIEELRIWAREHPGGQLHFQYDCEKPMLLAYSIP